MTGFRKFTSIESFAHVYRGQEYFDKKAVVHYGAKIKLHGTNAAVRVTPDGYAFAQSRSRDISVEDDNAGFAAFVSDTHDAWGFPPAAADDFNPSDEIIYYGEWAGKGIQKNDAVCQLDQKYFFVFAVYFVNADTYVVDPDMIEKMIPDLDQVLVLPWDICWTAPVDFNNAEACTKFANGLANSVADIGERDPFIYGVFGVDGPGEGWVVTPLCNPQMDPRKTGTVDAYWYERLTFKVKTEAHAVKKGPSASKEFVVPEGVPEFVTMFVTNARCEQGLSEVGGVADLSLTGEFLKWIGQDVKKESVEELSDAGLDWKDVTKHVNLSARDWWVEKCKEI